jgi:hypothetical protein
LTNAYWTTTNQARFLFIIITKTSFLPLYMAHIMFGGGEKSLRIMEAFVVLFAKQDTERPSIGQVNEGESDDLHVNDLSVFIVLKKSLQIYKYIHGISVRLASVHAPLVWATECAGSRIRSKCCE